VRAAEVIVRVQASIARGFALACLVAAGTALGAPADAAPLPDVVLVVADDLGWGDLACYGATDIATPNLDDIARRGMRFTDAYAPVSVCTPTRFALLTGRYPWREGHAQALEAGESFIFAPDDVTLPALLRAAGYRTACIGKWHLGFGSADHPGSPEVGPLDAGFERYFGLQARWAREPRCWTLDRAWVGWRDGRVVPIEGAQERDEVALAHPDEIPSALLSETARFLEEAGDAPVFLLFAPIHVHAPHLPGAKFRGDHPAGRYGAFVEELDSIVGELLGVLDRAGRRDALLLFTSDNGGAELNERDSRGHRPNGPLRGAKADVWEGGVRVPLLAEWPERIPAGVESHEIVCLTDVFATCLAAANVVAPDGAGTDALDLLPWLRGEQTSRFRSHVVVGSSGVRDLAVRAGPWKLVALRDGSRELYRLDEDPGETHDVAAAHPEIVSELSALLARETGR
jgi:arylsulfatase A-like enzyme